MNQLDYDIQAVRAWNPSASTWQVVSNLSGAHTLAVTGDAVGRVARTTCDLWTEPCSTTFTLGGAAGTATAAAASVCAPCMPASTVTALRSRW